MLKGTLDGKTLSDFVDSINVIVDDCRIHINDKEIHGCAVDTSGVALVKAELFSDAFTEYIVTPSEMCIDIKKLRDALSAINSKEYGLLFTESTGNLEVTGSGYKYGMRLISPASIKPDPQKDPSDFNTPVTLNVDSQWLTNSVKAAGRVGDKITFEFDPEAKKFKLYSTDEVESMRSELDLTSDKVTTTSDTHAKSTFSTEYINKVARIVSKTERSNISIGTDMPIKIQTTISNRLNFVYLVAPRVEAP